MNSIKTKLLLLLILIALLPLAALGFINYFKTTEIFTEAVQDYLHTIVRAKESALVEYIESTETIGAAIATTDIVQSYVKLTNLKLSEKNQQGLKLLQKRVENLLYSFQETHWGRYHHIFLINRSNRIVISPNHGKLEKGSPSSHLNEDTSQNEWAMRAMQRGETTVSDYSSWKESDHSHQMLFYPVKDSNGRVQALLGFELQIPYEQQILTEGFSLGETGKIYLTTEDGVPIVYKGIENQVPLNTTGLIEVKASGTSAGRRMNAQGREVIDLYASHNEYPWILVAEIETDEAFDQLYNLQTILVAGLLGTLVLVLILALIFANAIVNPLRKLTTQMEKISLGDFNVDIADTRRKDEIGKLIQAFQRLVVSLKIAMKQLQQAKAAKKN